VIPSSRENNLFRQWILFIYLFNSRDNAIHPQGICGLGKTKETIAGPRPVYYYIRNPPPSAVRCAQVSGYEPPLQESEVRKNIQRKNDKLTLAPRGGLFHRLPHYPLIHSRRMGPILIRSIGHHSPHTGQLQELN
jgi:hypothetical protein